MSIIESAFLKTLKNSKKNIDIENKIRSQNQATTELNAQKTPKPVSVKHTADKQTISSRKDISSMSQLRRYSRNELMERRLIHVGSVDDTLVNEYRNLRTKLISGQSKQNFSTLVTSVVPDYDISLVVSNLATAFSLDASKTSVVVNADIGNTKLDQLFGISSKLGIIDYIESEELQIDKILYETPIARLRFVPSGDIREDSFEYFTTARMKNLVADLVARYPERYLFVNAPSIESSADARILLDSCDCVVLVVPYGQCNEKDIMNAMLTVGSKKFAGLILDDF